jgi:hypothetical protein
VAVEEEVEGEAVEEEEAVVVAEAQARAKSRITVGFLDMDGQSNQVEVVEVDRKVEEAEEVEAGVEAVRKRT